MGWILSMVIAGLIAGFWVTTSRAGYETARYEVDEKEGAFEIRTYEAHEVVATTMSGENQNRSFGKLFQYLSGENDGEEKIKMTTPVFLSATEEGTTREMQFVIPAAVVKAGAPAPSDPGVKKKAMTGGKMAVLRFSGRGTAAQRKVKLKELRREIESRGLSVRGLPVFAGYDPPWTPGLLRRNEVLLPVK